MRAEVLPHVVPLTKIGHRNLIRICTKQSSPLNEPGIAEGTYVLLVPGVDLLVAVEGARVSQNLGAPFLIAPHELLVVCAPNLSPQA